MQFTFNEGHIQLPSQWQDQSMQVLVSTDNSGINLVITREAVPQGTLTPELYQETLALYQGKLDGYTEHACREITLAEAPAWLLDYSWNGPEDEGNQDAGYSRHISLLHLLTDMNRITVIYRLPIVVGHHERLTLGKIFLRQGNAVQIEIHHRCR